MIKEMSLRGFESYLRGANANIMRAAKRGVLSGALRTLPIVQDSTRTAPPASPNGAQGAFNTGDYLRRWKAEATERGARVFNSAVQAPIIEEGRRAGATAPPKEAIARWVQRRLGLPRDEALKAAWPIAQAIGKRGLLPRRVLTSRLPQMARVIADEISSEIVKALRGEAS